jgi:3-oxoacyl-[acyl-carrier-protein] synthase II
MKFIGKNSRRVVVTGVGLLTSIGASKKVFWENLLKGKSNFSPVSKFDTCEFKSSIGAEIKDFHYQDYISGNETFMLGRTSQLAIAATSMALQDAGLSSEGLSDISCSVIIGTTNGESQVLESINDQWVMEGEELVGADQILKYPGNLIPVNIANVLKINAQCYLIPTACAAGNYAIGYGYDRIQLGLADVAIVGGSDSFSRTTYSGFNRMMSMAPIKCQPFDKNRKGIIVGEGSGILILESLDRATARGAKIYSEVLGYGLSCDASHMTIPSLEGVTSVMNKAMQEAGILPEDVDYISAHGTGTKMNDRVEAGAINQVFNKRKVPVSSIKSVLGHTMGAASAIEAITCCLVICQSKVPPTANHETHDEECDIDCVPNICRSMEVDVAMNNAFAFGGNNSCVIFGKFNTN